MRIALYCNPSQSYGSSLAIWDHTVLPATRHKRKRPALTPASQAATRFIYPKGMEGWVDLGSLIAARPGIEPTTAWSQVRRPNRYATKASIRTKIYAVECDYFTSPDLLRELTARLEMQLSGTEVLLDKSAKQFGCPAHNLVVHIVTCRWQSANFSYTAYT